MNRNIIGVLVWLLVVIGYGNAVAETTLKTAVIPFRINAQEDVSYIRDGITEILVFRLSEVGHTQVIDQETIDRRMASHKGGLTDEMAMAMGSGISADFVCFGSLAVFGNAVNLNARLVDVTGKAAAVSHSKQLPAVDNIIPEVNLFADRVVQKLSAGQTPAPEVLPQADKTATPKPPPSPSFIQVEKTRADAFSDFTKIHEFPYLIRGFATGDVNRDGVSETVVITPHEVHVCLFQNKALITDDIIFEDLNEYLISVDMADINGNGYPEMFVTALNAGKNSVYSFVAEYDGDTFVTLVKDVSWYFRAMKAGDQTPVLFGQSQHFGGPDIFSGNIYQMAWNDNEYVPMEEILPSGAANLLGFAVGHFMMADENAMDAVSFNRHYMLQVTGKSGAVQWTGSESFGRNMAYFVLPRKEPGVENRQHFPRKIQMVDLDHDGTSEVAISSGSYREGSLLGLFSQFNHSEIRFLSWDGLGLSVRWKTRNISGQITDFIVADIDNDNQAELAASVITATGSIVTSPTSAIIAYKLN